MGGLGSGRWQTARYRTVDADEVHRLDVRALARDLDAAARRDPTHAACVTRDFFVGVPCERSALTVAIGVESEDGARRSVLFTHTLRGIGGTQQSLVRILTFVATHPHYGGRRWWAECPGLAGQAACGRRAGILYHGVWGTAFACRRCWQLRYPTQRMSDVARLERKARRLYARAGASLLDEVIRRPKGMHHRTHARLLTAAAATEEMALARQVIPVCTRWDRLRGRVLHGSGLTRAERRALFPTRQRAAS